MDMSDAASTVESDEQRRQAAIADSLARVNAGSNNTEDDAAMLDDPSAASSSAGGVAGSCYISETGEWVKRRAPRAKKSAIEQTEEEKAQHAQEVKDKAARARATVWLFAALNSIEGLVQRLFELDVFFAGQDWVQEHRPSIEERTRKRLKELAG